MAAFVLNNVDRSEELGPLVDLFKDGSIVTLSPHLAQTVPLSAPPEKRPARSLTTVGVWAGLLVILLVGLLLWTFL